MELFLALLSLALALVGLLSLMPRPTVSPTTPLNPADPFSAPFVISNEGFVPLKNVGVECQSLTMETENHLRVVNVGFKRFVPPAGIIGTGEQHAVPLGSISISGVSVIKADAELIVHYRSAWVPLFRKTNIFRFVLAGQHGKYRWLPRARVS